MKVGLAADHGGFNLKEELKERLQKQNYEIIDFGASQLDTDDDYPDMVLPLARAISNNELDRGIAICGSGVGASVAANKIAGARAALIHEIFSAHQGVEDDNINIMCLGGRVIAGAYAWELTNTFLNAEFIGAERHKRRLNKIEEIKINR